MVKVQAKITARRKYRNLIYNSRGKSENLADFSDEEVVRLAYNVKEGVPFATPVFDGANESEIKNMLELAGLPRDGQGVLTNGHHAERFDRPVTVGSSTVRHSPAPVQPPVPPRPMSQSPVYLSPSG